MTNNAAYASLDSASYIGVLYTTDTNGAGTEGDSAFTDINPASYNGDIVFNAEVQYNNFPILGSATSYFAVQMGAVAGVGGNWYVSTTPFASDVFYPGFASNSLAFNPDANNWDTLAFQGGRMKCSPAPSDWRAGVQQFVRSDYRRRRRRGWGDKLRGRRHRLRFQLRLL